ncbi:pimeloyl-ACP methyl ester carboxylesterase [Chitinophaga niastensis]|uniref:Pimeloyl-ACP methyl ester carboxylesterase n=1 Tax=Chitinophaga niastensis TaxID=536980 RepID=A0A2P8HJB6_CHINA|nr:alpha/beta hydrolase [Chitinophaga niastensis]PSL46306.1 pimeloyl-ACP methyl ester carboxylesterase [Chitinophaga niastensis]
MSFIKTADGTSLFYKECGTGNPVVLVHGWCINCDSWEYLINELVDNGFRCIAYDQRGCGRSDQPWTGYDYGTLANDLSMLIDTLGLNNVTLIGHSMGCGVVTRYLAEHGETKVKKAVFISTSTPYVAKSENNPDGIDLMYLDQGLDVVKKDRPAFVRSLVDGYFGLSLEGNDVSTDMADWAVSITLQASSRAAVEMMNANFITDQREELKKISMPVLLLHGDKDISAPIQITATATHDLLKNSELKFIEGQTHGMYISKAKLLSKDIIHFIV